MTAHKPTAVEALCAAEKALRPFYDAVFNDNGDITVSGPHPYEDAVQGYFAYKKIAAALAAQPEESVHPTDGWVTVPREPTREMLDAANREWDGRMDARSSGVWQAMLSAAPAAPGRDEWRGIESAPKDGARIMGAKFTECSGWRQYVMFWNEGWRGHPDVGDHGPFWQAGGLLEHPTHWRPLPSAPAKEA